MQTVIAHSHMHTKTMITGLNIMGILCIIVLVGIGAIAYISYSGGKSIDERYNKLDDKHLR